MARVEVFNPSTNRWIGVNDKPTSTYNRLKSEIDFSQQPTRIGKVPAGRLNKVSIPLHPYLAKGPGERPLYLPEPEPLEATLARPTLAEWQRAKLKQQI